MSIHHGSASTYRYPTSASPAHPYAQGAYGSPISVSSWGTCSTGAPLPKVVNSPSTYSFGLESPSRPAHLSPLSSGVHGSPWSHSQYESVHGQSRASLSSPSSYGTVSLPRSGPPQPLPNIAIIPVLNVQTPGQQRLYLDLSRAPSMTPSTYNYHPDMSSSAFHPGMTYAHITIQGPVKWSFRIHMPQALTVYDVLSQIYHYLQGYDGNQESLSSMMKPQSLSVGDYRDHNAQRGSYGSGVKRCDLLGPRHFLAGFEPAHGENAWNVYLSTGKH